MRTRHIFKVVHQLLSLVSWGILLVVMVGSGLSLPFPCNRNIKIPNHPLKNKTKLRTTINLISGNTIKTYTSDKGQCNG